MPFLLLLPVSGHLSRGFTVPPTKRAYSALHPQALTECSPLDFRRSSIDNGVVQARNLLRRNNLSGDLTDDCVNNFMSFYE